MSICNEREPTHKIIEFVQESEFCNWLIHPYVSPLTAKNLSHLPPAVVILAEKDDLRAAGQKYGDRLISASVPTQVYCQMGTNHLAGDGARASLSARESLDVAVTALQNSFSKN